MKRVWLVLVIVLVVSGTIGVLPLIYGDQRHLREVVLETALRSHLDGRPRFAPTLTNGDTLRGVSYEQANGLLDSCANVEDWTFLGEEQRGAHDCQLRAVFSCKRPEGSVIARIFAESEPGDRMGKLAAWSDFLACSPSLCPDFTTGEPRPDDVLICETAYKVRPVGESIVK